MECSFRKVITSLPRIKRKVSRFIHVDRKCLDGGAVRMQSPAGAPPSNLSIRASMHIYESFLSDSWIYLRVYFESRVEDYLVNSLR